MIDLSLLTQDFIDKTFAQIVLNGNKEDVAFYAEFVNNPNVPEPRFGRLPIWMALEHVDTYDKTKILLSLNPDINVKNEFGQTPVMVALSKRMSGVGVLFLRHPSLDVHAVDNKGDRLMKYAVMCRSAKAVLEAAKAGAALSPIDAEGNIPAYYAVLNDDFDVFEALCRCGLKRNSKDDAYRKVVKLAFQKSVEDKSLRWIRAVLRGVFPKEKSYKQTTSWEQLYDRIKRLPVGMQSDVGHLLGISSKQVEKKPLNATTAKQNVQDVLGQALIEQVRYGTVNDVAVLLRLGVNPNVRGRMGRTALFCAVEYMGNPEEKASAHEISDSAYRRTKLLLEAGADPNLSTLTPCNRERIPNSTPIISSLLLNRLGITQLLIKNGAKLKTEQKETLFKIAVQFAKPEAIPILIRGGLDLWQAEQSEKLLDEAVRLNKPYTVAMIRNCLIEQGINFDKYYASSVVCQKVSQDKTDMIAALQGVLAQPSRPKPQTELSGKTLAEKIATLSPQKKEKLRIIIADMFWQSGLSRSVQEPIVSKNNQHFFSRIAQSIRQFFKT